MFLTAISLSTTLALPKKSSGQTMNNKNNYSVTITKLSVSDYQKMIDQRDKNIQAQLDNWDSKETVTEYLERTQKEIFLSSYKHNKNMVRNNIDKIGIVLKNKYLHKELKDPIEILNTAIRKIANSGKIEGLSIYANKINVGVFNKNTIVDFFELNKSHNVIEVGGYKFQHPLDVIANKASLAEGYRHKDIADINMCFDRIYSKK